MSSMSPDKSTDDKPTDTNGLGQTRPINFAEDNCGFNGSFERNTFYKAQQ